MGYGKRTSITKHRHFDLARRKSAADLRQAAYNLLSTAEKLAKLDTRLGDEIGATKERAKLTGIVK